MNITVLVSGSGTNLQNIIDATQDGRLAATRVLKVIADRECFALERAAKANIPYELVARGKDFSARLDKAIPRETDYIVLAGFLSILSPDFTDKWAGKIINIHPSLLPKYGGKGMYGMKVHKAVIENHEEESGATVHYVNAGVDTGDIILQESIAIEPDWDAVKLSKAVLQLEYDLMIQALQKLENSN